MKLTAEAAAWILVGMHLEIVRRGEVSDDPEFNLHRRTALEIVTGGTYRGPMVIAQMLAYATIQANVIGGFDFANESTTESRRHGE